MNTEIRKPIPGYSNYEASNTGNIYQIRRNRKGSNKFKIINKLLIPRYNSYGYTLVNVKDDNFKSSLRPIHRLVAFAFLDNPENKPQVNHKNGIKTDNSLENLEWMTASENCKHAVDTGLRKIGYGEEASGFSYFTTKEVIDIVSMILDFKGNSEIAIKHQTCAKIISQIRMKKRWKEAVWDKYFPGKSAPESIFINSKHNIETQLTVIKEILSGDKMLKDIAIKYNINKSVISRVKNKKVWKAAWQKLEQLNAQRLSNTSSES